MSRELLREIAAELDRLPSQQLQLFLDLVRAKLPSSVRNKLPAAEGSPHRRLQADLKSILSLEASAADVAIATWLDAGRAELGAGDFDRLRAHEAEHSGPNRPLTPNNAGVPEKTKIDLRDDMVAIDWLANGQQASLSVAYLEVPRIFGGARVPGASTGTGFLIDPMHVLTAFHVLEARDGDTEGPASRPDLALQVDAMSCVFDYTRKVGPSESKGTVLAVSQLVAHDDLLDFAVLRLTAPAPVKPLTLWRGALPKVEAGLGFSVNIIQHPDGRPKQLALRNNAVWKLDQRKLYYFTDTLGGSSGAPVFNDAWRVVALHTGYDWFTGASYMGRKLGYANRGTRMDAILQHLAGTGAAVSPTVEQ